MTKRTVFPFLAAITMAASGGIVYAAPSGTIRGVVFDQSSAAVAGVKITLTNIATQQKRETETDGLGH